MPILLLIKAPIIGKIAPLLFPESVMTISSANAVAQLVNTPILLSTIYLLFAIILHLPPRITQINPMVVLLQTYRTDRWTVTEVEAEDAALAE